MNTKLIAWITGSLTLLMAAFSFVLSFNALTDLAAKHGVSIPPLFPLVVEAGVVIFSLNALYRSIHGESARWQWMLIVSSSLLAGAFNVAHAQADLLSRTMAAMPSLFLLLSFETFLGQIKHAVKVSSVVKSLSDLMQEIDDKRQELNAIITDKQAELDAVVSTKQTELDTLAKQAEKLNAKITQAQAELDELAAAKVNAESSSIRQISPKVDDLNAARLAKKEQAMTVLLAYLSGNPDASLSEAGQVIGRSKTQVSNYIDELTAAGQLHRNGQGWEVTR